MTVSFKIHAQHDAQLIMEQRHVRRDSHTVPVPGLARGVNIQFQLSRGDGAANYTHAMVL